MIMQSVSIDIYSVAITASWLLYSHMTSLNQSPLGCSLVFTLTFPSNIILNISLWYGERVLLVLTLSAVNTLILRKPQYAGESYIYSLYSAAATVLSIFFNSYV